MLHFLLAELEATYHMCIYEQHSSKKMCSQVTHKPLLYWEAKGPLRDTLHICQGDH